MRLHGTTSALPLHMNSSCKYRIFEVVFPLEECRCIKSHYNLIKPGWSKYRVHHCLCKCYVSFRPNLNAITTNKCFTAKQCFEIVTRDSIYICQKDWDQQTRSDNNVRRLVSRRKRRSGGLIEAVRGSVVQYLQ